MHLISKSRLYMFLGYAVALFLGYHLLKDARMLIILSDRGLDFTDEAFYALSYSTRGQLERSFTGATWIIGSIYDLCGQDLAKLRTVKVLALALSGGFLGWQTYEWLYSYKKDIIKFTKKELWGWKSAVVFGASLGALAPYTWTAATPSYNDINLFILLIIAGICLSLLRNRKELIFTKAILFQFCAIGFLIGVETFVKFSSALISFSVLVPIILYYFDSYKSLLKTLISFTVGFLIFWILSDIVLVDLFNVLPKSLKLIKVIAEDGYDPKTLADGYFLQLKEALKIILRENKFLFLFCFILPTYFKKLPKYISAAGSPLIAIPIILALRQKTYILGGPGATVYYGRLFILAILLFTLALSIGNLIAEITFCKFDRRTTINQSKIFFTSLLHIPKIIRKHPVLPALWILLLTPFVQAAGTLNDILTGATFSNVTWLLAALVIATWFNSALLVRYAIIIIVIFGTWGIHHKIGDGFIHRPYRLIGRPDLMNTQVKGLPIIDELRFDKPTAEYLTSLREIKEKENIKTGAMMLGIYNLPGEVYALGGVSPGEPWYFNNSLKRNLSNINYSCKTGLIGKMNPPVILMAYEPEPEFLTALSDCGIDFPSRYKLAGEAVSPFTLATTKFYVPMK